MESPRRRIPDGMAFDNWAAPDGWAMRRFRWAAPVPARGSLLFLGGRGDFVEKYLEALIHWHARGWDLAGFDWRGQGGSGRPLADPLICHQASFDPLVDDLAAFVADWQAETPGPHAIVAHSMGAHLALRLLAERDVRIDALVLAAPMIRIRFKWLSNRALGGAARLMVALGRAERRLWRRDPGDVGGRMTSCPERVADKHWWKAARPELASGGPSWGWLDAACASIARLPLRRMEAIATPALLLVSRDDPIIDVGAVRAAAAHLPDAELTTIAGTSHELLREADAIRTMLYARIDAFLDRATGADGKAAATP